MKPQAQVFVTVRIVSPSGKIWDKSEQDWPVTLPQEQASPYAQKIIRAAEKVRLP